MHSSDDESRTPYMSRSQRKGREDKPGYHAVTRGWTCGFASKASDRRLEAQETEAAKQATQDKVKAIGDYRTALTENWKPTADTPLIFEIGRNWIYKCVTNHQECRPDQDNYCPTRLLESLLGSSIEGGEGIKNYYNCESPETKRGIPIESLPQLYRDAIKVTRNLGESFLWIDSLCIIQDSEDDWAQESDQMGNVYANALCTISADAATGSNETLFPTRDLNKSLESLNSTKYEASYIPWGYLRPPSSSRATFHPAYHVSSDLIAASPTSSRGWCLQERQLSRRILHFTSQQVLWECGSLNASEIYPQGLPLMPGKTEAYQTQPVGPAYHRELYRQLPRSVISTPDTMQDEMRLLWYWFLVEFSKRILTFPSDRLPAISGIAQDLSRKTKETYIAGLWKSDLLYGLCWISSPTPDNRIRLYDSAPSWSWASVTGPIQFQEHFERVESSEPILEVEDFVITPLLAHNPTGSIRSGMLKVRGYLSFGKILKPVAEDEPDEVSYDGSVKRTVEWDNWTLPYSSNEHTISVNYDLDVPQPKGGNLFCLHLGATTRGGDIGLVLVPVPVEGLESTYMRIGLLRTNTLFFAREKDKNKVSLCII
ncbi:hypothetical protein G7Y89_g15365 [Cudoniella acicularis]|uniref:Heterokaryon incompatibility domain-containing protein n=1 Tax=Cudoniella acicularis TaxID=354080 RepID=A0A8H4QNG0_9HELO|nr:hypothetical protein G7Y89_g15365 [Cudoniella acicularis]